jgi:hypothetical protein
VQAEQAFLLCLCELRSVRSTESVQCRKQGPRLRPFAYYYTECSSVKPLEESAQGVGIIAVG